MSGRKKKSALIDGYLTLGLPMNMKMTTSQVIIQDETLSTFYCRHRGIKLKTSRRYSAFIGATFWQGSLEYLGSLAINICTARSPLTNALSLLHYYCIHEHSHEVKEGRFTLWVIICSCQGKVQGTLKLTAFTVELKMYKLM